MKLTNLLEFIATAPTITARKLQMPLKYVTGVSRKKEAAPSRVLLKARSS
jgi:hypothetical protein